MPGRINAKEERKRSELQINAKRRYRNSVGKSLNAIPATHVDELARYPRKLMLRVN